MIYNTFFQNVKHLIIKKIRHMIITMEQLNNYIVTTLIKIS